MANLKSSKDDTLKSAVFKTPDGSKIIAEKNKSYTGNVDGVELTVEYKVAAKLRRLLSQDYVYDPQIACNHILSVDEVYARMEEMDPNHHSDWENFITPELDTGKMEALPQEELLERYAVFIDICNRTAQDSVLQKVLELAPKKKNKTFAKNRVTVLAAFQAVNSELRFCELIAKATSDTALTLTLMERNFSEEEWAKSLNNSFMEMIPQSDAEKEKAASAITYATFSCNIPDYGKSKKLSMRFPVVRLENGEFALKASSK